MNTLWLTDARLLTPQGLRRGAVGIKGGRLVGLPRHAPRGGERLSLKGAYVAPGFIDLHVWGLPAVLSRELAKTGTTAFLRALGPAPRPQLLRELQATQGAGGLGAACLGVHLEGPYVNPARGGALPRAAMRAPSMAELKALCHAGPVRLITLAPELPRALEAIRWCRQHGVLASLGHSDAEALIAQQAVRAGATLVTHVFNGMRPFHHRTPTLADVALTEKRLTTMVIADGVHVSAAALRLLLRAKDPAHVALVTDSIRHQGWPVKRRGGAYYLTARPATLAGSDLTLLQAVRRVVHTGGASLSEAVAMASTVPARLLGRPQRGHLRVGAPANLTVFDDAFAPRLTMVDGRIVYCAN